MTSEQRVVLAASEHEEWSRLARDMAGRISRLLPEAVIEHIGSTSVPDLPAKPVVDLAVGMPADRVDEATEVLAQHGFDHEGGRAGHTWLSSPDRSARAYVIHVLDLDGTGWERRLRFRDILRTDASARAKYLAVKQRSAASSVGWDDYTQSKTAIVSELLGS
ncbi:GrpB family protein [Agrococcus sp. KRD186]|jgi:GrpB-like predicted nucleotidyltransferase (UPF0157 family)|uniref:GrpB family protein n=1 Tax=Agrococcus sp. KRD186 TaxID=2729730 RepID=UPI0019D0A73D|nr:GrpB family protein [Agrococcus sp. KRD186]